MTQSVTLLNQEVRYRSNVAEVVTGLVNVDRKKAETDSAASERFCESGMEGAVSTMDADSASLREIAENAGQCVTFGWYIFYLDYS